LKFSNFRLAIACDKLYSPADYERPFAISAALNVAVTVTALVAGKNHWVLMHSRYDGALGDAVLGLVKPSEIDLLACAVPVWGSFSTADCDLAD